jgi:hypothetical protein
MHRWEKLSSLGKRLCFWALMAALVAAGSGLLLPLPAVFLVLGLLLFGVVCAFAGPSPVPEPRLGSVGNRGGRGNPWGRRTRRQEPQSPTTLFS